LRLHRLIPFLNPIFFSANHIILNFMTWLQYTCFHNDGISLSIFFYFLFFFVQSDRDAASRRFGKGLDWFILKQAPSIPQNPILAAKRPPLLCGLIRMKSLKTNASWESLHLVTEKKSKNMNYWFFSLQHLSKYVRIPAIYLLTLWQLCISLWISLWEKLNNRQIFHTTVFYTKTILTKVQPYSELIFFSILWT
jgi:hypothetical protein